MGTGNEVRSGKGRAGKKAGGMRSGPPKWFRVPVQVANGARQILHVAVEVNEENVVAGQRVLGGCGKGAHG